MFTDHDTIKEFDEGDVCPNHVNSHHKKTYEFGSTMSAQTDVCVFDRCKCAVSISRDPIGILPSVARYHTSYNNASGVGRLRALDAAAKYR